MSYRIVFFLSCSYVVEIKTPRRIKKPPMSNWKLIASCKKGMAIDAAINGPVYWKSEAVKASVLFIPICRQRYCIAEQTPTIKNPTIPVSGNGFTATFPISIPIRTIKRIKSVVKAKCHKCCLYGKVFFFVQHFSGKNNIKRISNC